MFVAAKAVAVAALLAGREFINWDAQHYLKRAIGGYPVPALGMQLGLAPIAGLPDRLLPERGVFGGAVHLASAAAAGFGLQVYLAYAFGGNRWVG